MKTFNWIMMRTGHAAHAGFAAATMVLGTSWLAAGPVPTFYQTEPLALNSGVYRNASGEEVVAFAQMVQAPVGTPMVRVHFSGYALGDRSYVKITSVRDQQSQRLDAAAMKQWFDTSALFNGHQVIVELHVAPGEAGVYAQADQLVTRCNCGDLAGPLPETLCGSDNRVASTDNRVGRINGCTGWLVSNGAVLAAGHCPGGGVFEVNVPPSNADGTPNASAVTDQYPVITPAAATQNNGGGDDYMVFRLNPDTLGRRAHDRLGFFRLTRAVPSAGTTIRVTGYGVDSTPPGSTGGENAQTRTDQTSTGPYIGQGSSSPTKVWQTYAVDTTPANSGSPIIWESTNGRFAIGIHTNGGCNDDGSGYNSGTSFNNVNLAAILAGLPGGNTFYLDTLTYPGSPADTGDLFSPDHDLTAAYNHTPSGGKISVVAGAYARATSGNTGTFGGGHKAVTLVAPVGSVTIGN